MINKKINIKGILIKFCLIYAFFLNYNIHHTEATEVETEFDNLFFKIVCPIMIK